MTDTPTEEPRMTCANCGHKGTAPEFEAKAQQLADERKNKAAEKGDADPGEVIGSAYACPNCGSTEQLLSAGGSLLS